MTALLEGKTGGHKSAYEDHGHSTSQLMEIAYNHFLSSWMEVRKQSTAENQSGSGECITTDVSNWKHTLRCMRSSQCLPSRVSQIVENVPPLQPDVVEKDIFRNSQRQARLREALSNAVKDGEADNCTALRALKTWENICGRTPGVLTVPLVEFGADRHILFVWKKGKHYMDIEFIPNEPAQFFYEDCETHYLVDKDHDINEGVIPEDIMQAFTYFLDVK